MTNNMQRMIIKHPSANICRYFLFRESSNTEAPFFRVSFFEISRVQTNLLPNVYEKKILNDVSSLVSVRNLSGNGRESRRL